MGFLEDLGKKVADAGQKTKEVSDIVRLDSSDTVEKKYCKTCGAMLVSDAAFCENCGTKVS